MEDPVLGVAHTPPLSAPREAHWLTRLEEPQKSVPKALGPWCAPPCRLVAASPIVSELSCGRALHGGGSGEGGFEGTGKSPAGK